MLKQLFLILISICFLQVEAPIQALEGKQKIVYLISGPRALSTVFLRMIESREDFIIFNEPTIPVYDKVHYKEITEGWFRQDAHATFSEVKNKIFEAQMKSDVFIKDMSFSCHDYILDDHAFMEDSRIYFLFLVRDPHHSSISFYQKVNDIVPGMSDLIGLKKLYELYEAVQKENPNGVKIIFSEQLYNQPEATMGSLCKHLNIPYSEKAFTWKKYDQKFKGHSEWNEQKVGDHIHHWHGRAIQSNMLEKPNEYEVEKNGNPTFSEIVNESHRTAMLEVYRENLIYYKKFQDAKKDHLLID